VVSLKGERGSFDYYPKVWGICCRWLPYAGADLAGAEPDDRKWWRKIFYAARVSWTTSAKNWKSVDGGIFTANMEASKKLARRKVENMPGAAP